MINFFERKYRNLKSIAGYKKESIFILFFKKALWYVWSNATLIIDLIFSLIVLLCTIPILFFFSGKRKKKIVFFIGLEHIINKTADRALGYLDRHYMPFFFSLESTGKSHRVSGVDSKVQKYTFSIALDTVLFAHFLIKYKPEVVEMYFEGKLWRQLFASISARVFKRSLVYIERGLWYYISGSNISFLQKKNIQWLFLLPDLVLYREIGTVEVYNKLGISTEDFIFDYNRVRIKDEPDYELKKAIKTVLYLNSFKTFRRVDLFINAIPDVLKFHPDSIFIIVGAQNEKDLNYIYGLLSEINLANHPQISVELWTDDPSSYYEKSSVFVLPATLVYCNYSLLEAMERGLASISSNVQDAEKIITHDDDGILCELNSQKISLNIIKLFDDVILRDRLAKRGRQKIKEIFNDINRLDVVMELVEKNNN